MSQELQKRVDEAAARVVAAYGCTLEEARRLVLESMLPSHGTGH